MMNRQRWIFASLLTATLVPVSSAQADPMGPNARGPNQYLPGPNARYLDSANQKGGNEKVVFKRQSDIDENRHEIETLKEEIVEIRRSSKDLDEDYDNEDSDRGCECRPTAGVCEEDLFISLGVSPESGSCEELFEAVDEKLSKLPGKCKRKVRRCMRVARRLERKEQKAREKDAAKRIRELQAENKKLQKEGEITVIIDGSGRPCADCELYQQRGPSDLAILGSTALNVAGHLGLGYMDMRNKKRYYDGYFNAYNNNVNQYYGQIPGVVDHYTALGIPYNYQAMGAPLPIGMGGVGGLFGAGLNPGLALGGYGTGGLGGSPYGSPYGMGMGGMINGGIYPNPYGIGAQLGAYPYGMGMNNGYVPYMNGMGMNGGLNLGANVGMNPYGYGIPGGYGYGMPGGYGAGGYGAQSYYLLEQQRMQQQQQSTWIAQQQMQEAQYRYMQVQNNSYLMNQGGGWNLGYNPYGGSAGLGLNFGLSGSLNLGTGYLGM